MLWCSWCHNFLFLLLSPSPANTDSQRWQDRAERWCPWPGCLILRRGALCPKTCPSAGQPSRAQCYEPLWFSQHHLPGQQHWVQQFCWVACAGQVVIQLLFLFWEYHTRPGREPFPPSIRWQPGVWSTRKGHLALRSHSSGDGGHCLDRRGILQYR